MTPIDPFALAKRGETLAGTVAPEECSNIRDYEPRNLNYRLNFSVATATEPMPGKAKISGHISAELQLTCNRCAQLFAYPVAIDFVVYPVVSADAAEAYPVELDTIIIDNNAIAISDLVEQEVILALPVFPKHPDGSNACYNEVDCVNDQPDGNKPNGQNVFDVLLEVKNGCTKK
jgi:uncharacterized protein